MSGKHPRSNLPFATAAVPQFRWQLTAGGPVPAPTSAATASRAPRGSAAAAKRRSSCAPAASTAARQAPSTGAPSGVSLQRAWNQPDFLQRAWARPSAAAAAASAAAVAALLEAANSDSSLHPPKRLCVARNADALPLEEMDCADSARLDGDADEPRAKYPRTNADCVSGAAQPLPSTPRDFGDAVPPPVTPASLTIRTPPVPDEPPAKVQRTAQHSGSASSHLRCKGASSADSTRGAATSAAAVQSSPTVEPCFTVHAAPALRHEVASSSTAPAHSCDPPRPGTPPPRVTTTPIHCTARWKSREDLRRELVRSSAVSKTGSSCASSSIAPPAQNLRKRPVAKAPFPEVPFPAKRYRTSNSPDLGEFAAFFQKK